MVTQVPRSSNKWFQLISQEYLDFIQDSNQKRQNQKKFIHRFNRRLQFSIRRLNTVSESGQVHTLVKPMIFEINVGAVVQNVGFPGISKLILTG